MKASFHIFFTIIMLLIATQSNASMAALQHGKVQILKRGEKLRKTVRFKGAVKVDRPNKPSILRKKSALRHNNIIIHPINEESSSNQQLDPLLTEFLRTGEATEGLKFIDPETGLYLI